MTGVGVSSPVPSLSGGVGGVGMGRDVGAAGVASAVAAVGEGNAPVRGGRGGAGCGERQGAADFVPPRVRVALGIVGNYWDPPLAWDVPDSKGLKDMTSADLLTALSESRLFAAELNDVVLSRCTVKIVAADADKVPTPEQERAGRPFSMKTVDDEVQALPHGKSLCIRVLLPEAQAQGMYIRCVRLRPSICACSNNAPRIRGVLPIRMYVH
jgi:hypothetical protein